MTKPIAIKGKNHLPAVVGVRANNKRQRERPSKSAGHLAQNVVGETHDNGKGVRKKAVARLRVVPPLSFPAVVGIRAITVRNVSRDVFVYLTFVISEGNLPKPGFPAVVGVRANNKRQREQPSKSAGHLARNVVGETRANGKRFFFFSAVVGVPANNKRQRERSYERRKGFKPFRR